MNRRTRLRITIMAACAPLVLAALHASAAPSPGTVSSLTVDAGFNVTGLTVDTKVVIGPGVDLTVGTNVRLGTALGEGPERVVTGGVAPATQAIAERSVYDRSLVTGYQDTATNINTFNIVFDSPIANTARSEFILLMTTNAGTSDIFVQALDVALNPIEGQILNARLNLLAETTAFNLGSPPANEFYNITGYDAGWSTSGVGNFPQPLARALAVNFDATVPLGGVQISPGVASSNHIGVEAYGLNLPPAVPGDFNGDDVVDEEDYDFWSANFGVAGTGANFTGLPDADDYVIWRKAFSQTGAVVESRMTSVPEPSAAALGLVAFFVLAGATRRL